ncbi:response regulator transcription factor [Marinobacterium aestuariivivens]|uniref:Response regulator transcription factor n=1 Tax=Marinobacterium aestuariivivens TaxID=1698799 RepID=A0ABW2A6K1_9GAMM
MGAVDTTIFLVDDDSSVRDSLCLALHHAGFEVRSFDSGEAFVEAYRADGLGCLVLDLRMPGMSGLEVQQWLNACQARLPVIFISGHSDHTARNQAMQGERLNSLSSHSGFRRCSTAYAER